jgi:dihydrofolate reductase
MGKVVLGMTMPLDGFINNRNGSVERLYPDLVELGRTEMLQESIRTTGAVVMGRHAFAMGDPDSYARNYEYQVPIFVLCEMAPYKLPKQDRSLTFTFVTDGIVSALEKARKAAGDRNVQVIGGANVAQQCIRAGLMDEIQSGIMSVLLCGGLRLFEHLGTAQIQLERIRVIDSPPRTDLRFRVRK